MSPPVERQRRGWRRRSPEQLCQAEVQQQVNQAGERAVHDFVRTVLPYVFRRAEAGDTDYMQRSAEQAGAAHRATAQAAALVTALLNRVRTAAAYDVLATNQRVLDVQLRQMPASADHVARLLELPPVNAVTLRLALRAVVLAGGPWPGLCRGSVPLTDVVHAALRQVEGSDRVQLVATAEYGVVGEAVEPLIAALAELACNAVKASCDTGSTVLVEISPAAGRGATVSIVDIGPGMDPTTLAEAQAVLARQRHVHTASHNVRWTGLGLRLAAAAATTSGFTAGIWSAPGEGTTTRVLVPVHLLSDPSDAAVCADASASAASHQLPEGLLQP
ncbi:signal transduction histidine kinase [Kitasatospora sp. MAP12-15]|uniref:ATP-binding protein n=1 Tax=unclassified Kitasatospora TaxID=2633591 RepID=UPI0024770EDA|nr:ATP-binding protein [Kitasatospora sp. MAP12-44]MDH6111398.1 signal transduction histidine kinase [Kitasatospora sp. MAP12-44]